MRRNVSFRVRNLSRMRKALRCKRQGRTNQIAKKIMVHTEMPTANQMPTP
jgi:hypothetical protein